MITEKAYWISYDLGLKGDYQGLYTWLDTVGAKECGDSIAFFTKQYSGDIVEAIREDILKFTNPNKTDRIYLIYLERTTNKVKGKFIFGGRKRAPWEGYAKGFEGNDEDSL